MKMKPHPIIRIGTELVLCHATRRVRVLTLPSLCSNWRLIRGWAFSLDDDVNLSFQWPRPEDAKQNGNV